MQLSHNNNNAVWEVIKLDEDEVVKSSDPTRVLYFDLSDLDED